MRYGTEVMKHPALIKEPAQLYNGQRLGMGYIIDKVSFVDRCKQGLYGVIIAEPETPHIYEKFKRGFKHIPLYGVVLTHVGTIEKVHAGSDRFWLEFERSLDESTGWTDHSLFCRQDVNGLSEVVELLPPSVEEGRLATIMWCSLEDMNQPSSQLGYGRFVVDIAMLS